MLNNKIWPTELDYWPKAVIETIKQFSKILPTPIKKSDCEFYYETSNPHEILDLKLKTKNLRDIKKDPESWRIIIFFHNSL